MILELVKPDDPILHTPTKPFDFHNPPIDPKELFENMRESMMKYVGFGLSANQVGIPYSMFVFGDPAREDSIGAAFNPKIVHAENLQESTEGCLSYPELILKIQRPFTIRARYANLSGNVETEVFSNLTARVFSHELDHLNGITFGQQMTKFGLRRSLEKFNKRNKKSYVVGDFYPSTNE